MTDETTPRERMTGWELRARRERLGLTLEAMAGRLGVVEGTLRHWEAGRDVISYRIPEDVAALEGLTGEHVEDVAEVLGQLDGGPMPDAWAVAVVDRAQPVIRALGPRWWRHVVIDAATRVPGADFVPLLRFPDHWKRWGDEGDGRDMAALARRPAGPAPLGGPGPSTPNGIDHDRR